MMRVRVKSDISELAIADDKIYRLTSLQEYFILEVTDEHFRVVNDDGDPVLYPKYVFEICDRRVPSNWQYDEGEDGDYYLQPINTAEPGFYEDYFCSDGDRRAQARAREVLHQALEESFAWGQDADRATITRDLERLISRERGIIPNPTEPDNSG